MKKNLKKIMAIILAVIVVMTTFVACSKNKDESEGTLPTDEAVNATENSTEPTSEEGWSDITTKKEENTSKQSNETTTKASSNNGSQTTTKKPATTTKKHETTTKKPVTTTKPTPKPPVTTTKPPVTTTKPSSPYLTQAQKNQVINYYRDYAKHGAAPGYYVKEVEVGQVPGGISDDWTQDNFDRWMERNYSDWSEARNAAYCLYAWEDKDGKSILHYCIPFV